MLLPSLTEKLKNIGWNELLPFLSLMYTLHVVYKDKYQYMILKRVFQMEQFYITITGSLWSNSNSLLRVFCIHSRVGVLTQLIKYYIGTESNTEAYFGIIMTWELCHHKSLSDPFSS